MLERLLEAVVTAGEQLIEQGRLEGRTEGLKEGLTQGQQRTLLKQLQIRFSALPEAVLVRVKAADSAKLDLWAERVLTAPTLEDVLGP